MCRTTLPDTAFERVDNFLSNECIHTLFPFQIASSQAANQKSSGFCVFRFQTDFDEREHFVLSSLYRNIAFIVICELRTRHPGPTRASIIFSSHWNLCSKRSLRLAMHPFRHFCEGRCGFSYPVLGDMGPAEPQTLFQVVDILDLHGTPASPALPRRRIMRFKSGLFGGQASGLMYRRQAWSR